MKIINDSKLSHQLFSQLHELIFVIDNDGYIIESNQSKIAPKNVQDLFHDNDWLKIINTLDTDSKLGSLFMETEVELKISGNSVWYLCKIGKLPKETSTKELFILALQNIQNQKSKEWDLIKSKEQAESHEKIKSSFMANMSHEIRTPMNSIIGFAELLKNATSKEDKTQYLDIIKSSGEHLLNIINDIIDISKIESGLLNIKAQRVNINDLVEELTDIYRSDFRLNAKKVKIEFSATLKTSEAYILTDGTRLRQILSNLMDNAVKFTTHGKIEIGYYIHEKEQNETEEKICFYVKDTGLGIPKAEQGVIFDRFHQVREGDESKGSGLGLAIVDALVHKLGGEISIDSESGVGSEFSFCFPFLQRKQEPIVTQQQDDTISAPILKGCHVLIAEDVPANFKFLSAVMRKTQAKLTWAKNGKEAVESVLNSNNNYDIVLMDLRMPIMDGYKASGHIKTIEPKLPIIALTAFAIEGDMEKALEAGCDDYLSKPISVPDLYRKLDFFINL